MTKKFITESARQVPVIAEADVVVVGGGTAGIGAALAAARQGAKTILVEQLPYLGGTMATGGLAFHGFFNNYKLYPNLPKIRVVNGIPEMLLQRLAAAGGSFGHVETEVGVEIEPDIPTYDPIVLQTVTFELMKQYGVRLFMRTWFADVLVENGVPYGIIVESKGGRGAILGKEFIDCTGDADLAARAGAPCLGEMELPKRHPIGLIFSMAGVDLRRALAFGERMNCVHRLTRVNKGTPQEIISILWLDFNKIPGWKEELEPFKVGGVVFGGTRNDYVHYVNAVNVPPTRLNLDPEDALETELELRTKAHALTAFLNRHVEGFEAAGITQFAPLLGVRNSRIVQCEYEITFEDIREERSFPDEIGRYAWVDIHTPEYQPRHGGGYGVPFRAIMPQKIDHLLVAGRLITTEIKAHQSTRNTVHAMMQGEAAGTAAALAIQQGVPPRRLDVKLLQDTLLQNGVILNRE